MSSPGFSRSYLVHATVGVSNSNFNSVMGVRLLWEDGTELCPGWAIGMAGQTGTAIASAPFFFNIGSALFSSVRLQVRASNGQGTTFVRHATLNAIEPNAVGLLEDDGTSDAISATPLESPLVRHSGNIALPAGNYLIMANAFYDVLTNSDSSSIVTTLNLDGSLADEHRMELEQTQFLPPDENHAHSLYWAGPLAGTESFSLTVDMIGSGGSCSCIRSQFRVYDLEGFDSFSLQYQDAILPVDDYPPTNAEVEIPYGEILGTVSHTVLGGLNRRHLILGKVTSGNHTSAHLFARMQVNGLPFNFNQEDEGGGIRYTAWDNSDRFPVTFSGIYETDTDFDVTMGGTSVWRAIAQSYRQADVRRRMVLVIDLGPAPVEQNRAITNGSGSPIGITGTDNSLGVPTVWQPDAVSTIECFIYRTSEPGPFTFLEFAAAGGRTFMVQRPGSTAGNGDVRIITMSNGSNPEFTIDVEGAMPITNHWYHLVLRFISAGNFTAYIGSTGRDAQGNLVKTVDSFPTGYASGSSVDLADGSTGLMGLGIGALNCNYSIGFGEVDTTELNGGVSEIRVWAGDIPEREIEDLKGQFVQWSENATTPLDRLHVCLRMNTENPDDGFIGSGWRQFIPDTFLGGSTAGHPFATGGSAIHMLQARMAGRASFIRPTMTGSQFLSCVITGASSLAVELHREHDLAATVAGSSVFTAELDAVIRQLSMTINGSGVLTPGLNKESFLALTLNGSGRLTPRLIRDHILALTLNGAGTLTAEMVAVQQLACTMAGSSALSVDLNKIATLVIRMAGAGALFPFLSEAEMFYDATMAGDSRLRLNLTRIVFMGCTMAGSSEFSPAFNKPLNATMSGAGRITAALTRVVPLDCTMAGSGVLISQFTQRLDCTMAGSGSLSGDLTPVRSMICRMDGSGRMTSDAEIARFMSCTLRGSGSLSPDLHLEHFLSLDLRGDGDLRPSLAAIPVGGAGEIFDGPSLQRFFPRSKHPYEFSGTFVIPSGFTINSRIRIGVIPAKSQLMSMSIDNESLGSGSASMSVGTELNEVAFMSGIDPTVEGLTTMTSGGQEARQSEVRKTVYLTFTGSMTFTVGAAIQLAGSVLRMTAPERTT